MNRMVPRRAGQTLRERHNQMVKLSVLGAGGAYLATMLVAFLIKPGAWVFYAISTPIVVGLFLWMFKKRELTFVRGKMLNLRQGAVGEEQVGALLDSLTPKGYRSLHDVPTGKGNIDHVVVGPNGVFVIETKAVSGRVWLAKGGRVMNKTFAVGWVSQAQAEAFEVKDCIQRTGLNVWIDALVVLTRTKLAKGPINKRWVKIIEAGDLLEVILTKRGTRLTPAEINRAVAAILRGDQVVKVGA